MKDINKIILIGRLGADPIQRQTKGGTTVVHLSVATSRRVFREGAGDGSEASPVEETQWHRVIVWGRQGEVCAQYLKKASSVYVEGYLRSRSYEGKDGLNKTTVEVHAENVSFLGHPRTEVTPSKPEAGPSPIGESNLA